MEDDDEFGDLYTDVLRAFPSSSSAPPSTAPPLSLPIDLNLQSNDVDALAAVPNSQFIVSNNKLSSVVASDHSSLPNSKPKEELGVASNIQGFDSPAPEASGTRVLQTTNLNSIVDQKEGQDKKDGADELDVAEADDREDNFHSKKPNFGIKEELNGGMEDLCSEPIIPGLDTGPSACEASHVTQDAATNFGNKGERNEDAGGDGDDWDSDSEDDLQIVLNDNNHRHMGMETSGIMVGSDDEDEDGEPLIIVADDGAVHQPSEEQDWGEDAVQVTDGKDMADAAKPSGGLTAAPKIGYSNYGYHPFHSQFKYVRPGAAPLPGGPHVGSGAPGQVRPPVNLGAMPGRGRGDWRPPGIKAPPMQKGFHSGFWGSNGPGRGLEFTLPSHKTIFDVDIDNFEEKPWRYPGVDVSDFFNFGLNEESWKEYCKQLEQLRLESTMQSKIRVYESGRAEQEYDPDLPPELAAASGIHDSSAENANITKAEGGLGDIAKGSTLVRPPLPTGRAIQVETGFGERLPSVDTRPPRLRDSDAVIEIILQGSMDKSSSKDATEHLDNDNAREDGKVDVVGEDGPQNGDEYFDGYPQGYGSIMNVVSGKRSSVNSSPDNDVQEEERDRSSLQRTSSDNHSGSRGHTSIENVGSPYEERWSKGKKGERSPHTSSGESALDRRSHDYQQENSIETMEGKRSPVSSSHYLIEDAQEQSLGREFSPENDVPADKEPEKIKDINVVFSSDTSKDRHRAHPTKHQKLSSHVEPPANKDDDAGEFKASGNSINNRATGSSRDHQKWHEGTDEEVQNGRFAHKSEFKRHRGEGGHDSLRDWDPYASSHVDLKSEGIDRKKERDYSEVSWQRRDEDAHGWRLKAEDAKKQDRAEEMVSRHRSKAKEIDRSDKNEYLHSRKLLDNGSWRVYHDKDVGLRYREKDDGLKSRHEALDDHHSKRRKDEHVRREHVEKEDMLLDHTESSSTRRKRERDDISNQRKRDGRPRARDMMDDHHSSRLNDEVWMQRERAVQQRERDEWYRSKLSYEENMSRRDREDGRIPIRSSKNVEEKTWVGHSRGKEEYKGHDKETGRHGEQISRRELVEDGTSFQHKGNDDGYSRGSQVINEGKRSRLERSSARNDRPDRTPDNQRVHEKKHKDYSRKARESEGTSGPSRRHVVEKGHANEMAVLKGLNELDEAKHDNLLHNLTRESRDDVSSDDEQHGSKRGRSKLERWTSHKERDYAINSKLSSSFKVKDISKDKSAGFQYSSGAQDESVTRVEDVDKNMSLGRAKDGEGLEGKEADMKPMVDGHLDTVEKLKRRSERFKLPLASEKDITAVKKMESEALPPSQSEAPANSEVKQERPARKRRWISS